MSITNDQVAKWVTRGTTTPADKVIVLYNDGNWALVKWPGGSVGSGLFPDYVSAWVTQYDLGRFRVGQCADGFDVWNCARDGDGPMTLRNLEKLVDKHHLDKAFICYTPTKRRRGKQEPIPTSAPVKKKRRFKFSTSAVQIALLIEGESLPDDWDDCLCRTKIAGSVCETSTQINGHYLVLEYNTLADCMDFIKADKESLINALETL
jgi:hypothetical protein